MTIRERIALLPIVAAMLAGLAATDDLRFTAGTRARAAGLEAHPRDGDARVLPVVSFWYRGQPLGTPRQDDLAAIRAVGFTAVAWPIRYADRMKEVQRLAAVVGLSVSLRADPRPLTLDETRAPGTQVDINLRRLPANLLPAAIWRAVAHGARDVAFDPGEVTGTGLGQSGEAAPAWLTPAVSLARQFSANSSLFSALTPAPRVTVEAPGGGTADVVLLETDRTWVLIATSIAAESSQVISRLPVGVPSALWVSLLDGEAMSMFDAPGGARWTVTLPAGSAAVYLIDKKRLTAS